MGIVRREIAAIDRRGLREIGCPSSQGSIGEFRVWADQGGKRTTVIASLLALEMEVAVLRVDEERVLGKAVLVGERRILPGCEGWPSDLLPEGNLPAPCGVQKVVVAPKPALRIGCHGDVVSALNPEDIVGEGDVV